MRLSKQPSALRGAHAFQDRTDQGSQRGRQLLAELCDELISGVKQAKIPFNMGATGTLSLRECVVGPHSLLNYPVCNAQPTPRPYRGSRIMSALIDRTSVVGVERDDDEFIPTNIEDGSIASGTNMP